MKVLGGQSDSAGEPLLKPVMRGGRRVAPSPSLGDVRAFSAGALARLPEPLRRLELETVYPVSVGQALIDLTADVDGMIEAAEARP